jgi:hypothetical protein
MLPITNFLWQHLPKLRFVQLPWRWLLCLNAAVAILLTIAVRRWPWRALAGAALLAAVVLAGYRIQPPWWDSAADIKEMSDAMSDGTGYEGTDEYVPAGADPYELKKNAPLVADSSGSPIRAEILAWQPAEKHFVVHSNNAELLTLRLFNYPAWQVAINGKEVATQTTEVTGQMSFPVAAGRNDVRIQFNRTRDRTVGGWISVISLGLLFAAMMATRPTAAMSSSA